MRRSRSVTLIGLAMAVALLGAGCDLAFQVTKSTTGDNPGTGPFEVEVTCEISNPEGPEPPTIIVTDTLTFDGPTFPQTLTSEDFEMDPNADCLLVETGTGGASTTTIECVEPVPDGVECTNTAEGLEVSATIIPEFEDILVEIAVTNDFGTTPTTAPVDPASLAIVTEPAFTG
jgi:hypothetical protein